MEPVSYNKNVLLKGLNTNIDPSRSSADTAWEILNGRVYSVDGNSFVVKNIEGNKEYFSLQEGFTLIGGKTYNNILYLVSVNEDNIVEVGSYPSLRKMSYLNDYDIYQRYTISELDNLEYVYKPLPSIQGGSDSLVSGFRTSKWGFTDERLVYPLIKESYDGSVNIYICDGENPNRVVNSCFNTRTFEIKTDRIYKGNQINVMDVSQIENSVNKLTKQFLSINEPPYTRLSKVEEGGNLPIGNLFFYIRYLDYEFNKTNFVPLIGPVMITYGDDIFSISGSISSEYTEYSKKKITIDINNIDTAFKYFEIAMIWDTGLDESALAKKALLLDKRVPIVSDTEFGFTITGNESMASIDYTDVKATANTETISIGQTSLDNRWWAVGFKETTYDKDAMKELAKRCYVIPELKHRDTLYDLDGNTMNDVALNQIDADKPLYVGKKQWYQSPEYVLDRVGYYRGEVYPFSLVGLKEDGTFTDSFPITGFDFYNEYASSQHETTLNNESYLSDDENTNCGFVRFPQFGTGGSTSKIDDINYILLGKAKLEYMWAYLNDNLSSFNGITGFYILRGDRFENLLYHGVNLKTFDHYRSDINESLKYYIGTEKTREIDIIGNKISLSFPTPTGLPRNYNGELIKTGEMPTITSYESGDQSIYLHSYLNSERNRNAIYTPDYLLGTINKVNNNELVRVYIPYYNFPQYNSHSYSEILYSGYMNQPDFTLKESIYQTRFNYENSKYGRFSISGKCIRGYSWNVYETPDDPFIKLDEQKTFGYSEFGLINTTNPLIRDYKYHRIWGLEANDPQDWGFSGTDTVKPNPYIKVNLTNVDSKVFRGLNNYSSYLGDGLLSNLDIGFYDEYEDGVSYLSNRNIDSVKYLGIDFNDDSDDYQKEIFDQMSMFPILVYLTENNSDYYNDLVNNYKVNSSNVSENQLSEIEYRISTPFIDKGKTRKWYFTEKDSEGNNLTEYNFDYVYPNGDCFMSRFSFRQSYNNETYDIYVDDDDELESNPSGKHYNHGKLFSIVLQSDSNTGVRGQDKIGFYPLWASDWKAYTTSLNYNSVLCARFGGSGGNDGEDFIYNWGHSTTLPHITLYGNDDIYKDRQLIHNNRVRYSDSHNDVSFVDGWRTVTALSYADFPIEFGLAFAIATHGISLLLILEDAIIQLFPNEKAVSGTNVNSNNVATLGVGSILSDEYKKLSDFGSQHRAIIANETGVYGFDVKKGIFWKSNLSQSYSNTVLGIKPISNAITSFINERAKFFTSVDLVAGYNELEKEALVTLKNIVTNDYEFVRDDGTTIVTIPEGTKYIDFNGYLIADGIKYKVLDIREFEVTLEGELPEEGFKGFEINYGYTLSYSEKISSDEVDFITRVGINPNIYLSHNKLLLSSNRLFDEDSSKLWSHDNESQRHNFYGYNSWFKYGVVVNGIQSKNTFYPSIYASMITVGDQNAYDVVEYETEFQKTRHYPFNDLERFWLTPEHVENKWQFTIPTCEEGDNGYDVDSSMRGTWMKALFIYKGEESKYIGDIITKLVLSLS